MFYTMDKLITSFMVLRFKGYSLNNSWSVSFGKAMWRFDHFSCIYLFFVHILQSVSNEFPSQILCTVIFHRRNLSSCNWNLPCWKVNLAVYFNYNMIFKLCIHIPFCNLVLPHALDMCLGPSWPSKKTKPILVLTVISLFINKNLIEY